MSHSHHLAECAAQLRAWIRSLQPFQPPTPAIASETDLTPDAKTHDPAPFAELALRLFAAQFELNLPYRRFCQHHGATPASVTDWRQIPAVPTAAFKECDLSCIPPSARTTVFHSSGTTQQRPSRHFHYPDSLALYEASLRPWFAAHLLHPAANPIRMLVLTPPRERAPHSSLVHMFETVLNSFGSPDSAFVGDVARDGAWTLDFPGTLTALEQAVSTNQPLALLGTAFSFVHLLDDLAANQRTFQLPPGSRIMETGGYKGRSRSLPKNELHRLLSRQLGLPPSHIVCEYGMSELSSQAYDHLLGRAASERPVPTRIFRFPPWARAQIFSPETGQEVAEGQTGLIRILDLANVYSVMAIQTEDLGIRRGHGFELLGRATTAEPRGCSLMATT